MKKVWTTKARSSTATRTATTTTMTASLIQRVEWAIGRGRLGRRLDVRGPSEGGSPGGGSSTASTGSFGSGVTGGRLDGAAGAGGLRRGRERPRPCRGPERSSVPGSAPVGAPSRMVSTPLTRTRTTPCEPA